MNEHSPLDVLPTLPSGMDMGNAVLWASTILLNEAITRRWPMDDMRQALLTLVVLPTASTASDADFHAELQKTLDRCRSRRAVKS